jgi:hypothetical protein
MTTLEKNKIYIPFKATPTDDYIITLSQPPPEDSIFIGTAIDEYDRFCSMYELLDLDHVYNSIQYTNVNLYNNHNQGEEQHHHEEEDICKDVVSYIEDNLRMSH